VYIERLRTWLFIFHNWAAVLFGLAFAKGMFTNLYVEIEYNITANTKIAFRFFLQIDPQNLTSLSLSLK